MSTKHRIFQTFCLEYSTKPENIPPDLKEQGMRCHGCKKPVEVGIDMFNISDSHVSNWYCKYCTKDYIWTVMKQLANMMVQIQIVI